MRGGGGEVVGRLLFLFQTRDQTRRWRLVGKVYMALPALVLALVFFSYNTTSLAPPAMAASDGLSSAIFQ